MIDLLREAADLQARRGSPHWTEADFSLDDHRAVMRAGELFVAARGGEILASLRLQRADPALWPDDPPGQALYLHKVAVSRLVGGQGWLARLVAWSGVRALRAGAAYLRLDTLPETPLPNLYARLGFAPVDARPVEHGGLRLVRMQKRL